MLSVLDFWLDRGVDGFRIDVAHMLMKDPELNDNPPNPEGKLNPYDRQHADFNTQLHLNDRHHPDLHGVLRDMRRLIDSYGDRISIGELDVMPWAEWAEYYGLDLDELHLPLNFRLIETPWTARDVRIALEELERALPPGAWAVNNLGNHDRSRIASRYGQNGARLAAMLLLTARGTPLLYYGDELGMSDVSVPRERLQDGYSRRDDGPTRRSEPLAHAMERRRQCRLHRWRHRALVAARAGLAGAKRRCRAQRAAIGAQPIPSSDRATSALASAQDGLDQLRGPFA